MGIRFGIVGPGKIAKKFSEAVNLCSDAELYAVASRDIKRAEAFAKEYGAKVCYGSYNEMFLDPDVQAVYIATPHNFHVELAKQAIMHGKPVICEKAIGVNYKEVLELVTLAREKKVLLVEAMWTKQLPAYKAAKKWIDDKKVGDVLFMSTAFTFRAPFDEKSRFFAPELAGGALLDLGCYTTAVTLGLLGECPSEIKSTSKLSVTNVDENVAVALKFPSGIIAQMNFGVIVNGMNQSIVYTTDGRIEMSPFHSAKVARCYNDKNELIDEFVDETENGFIYQVQDMCNLISSGKTESENVPLDETLDVMHVLDELQNQFYSK